MNMRTVNRFFEDMSDNKQLTILGLILGISLLGLAGYGIIRYNKQKQGQEAQKSFSEAVTEFERALAEGSKGRWSEVVQAFDTAHQRYGSTWVAPYLLVYKADALQHAGNTSEALSAMDQAITSMTNKSPLYYMYATKLALMKSDSKDEAVQKQGIVQLDELAFDIKNPQRGMAQYYVGLLALSRNDISRAREMWAMLIEREGEDSVWGGLAAKNISRL